MNTRVNVLVTSAGRRGQLVRAFQRVTRDYGGKVFAADASGIAPATYLADKAFVVPPVRSSSYIDAILELCESESVKLLVPTIDTELEVLSLAKNHFAEIGVHVLVSSPECIQISLDKRETNRWLMKHGFPVPQQWSVKQALLTQNFQVPVFIKPARGSRSVGARKVEILEDLRLLNTESDLVIEEFIQGDEYTISTYVDLEGRCLAAIPRQRVEVREGEVSKAITRHVPDVEYACTKIVEGLPGAWGPLNIQLMLDPATQKFTVIEINARFGGGDPLAWKAGANAPRWAVREVLGRTPRRISGWKRDLAMLRFDDAVFTELNEV